MMDGYPAMPSRPITRSCQNGLNVDKSSRLPIYTRSNKAYVIRLLPTALSLECVWQTMDGLRVKGYMTIEYMYPLNP